MNDLKTKVSAIVKKGSIRFNEPLARYTTLKIGGPADIFVETGDVAELSALWKLVVTSKIPYKVIGGGSNLLFSDRGFSGIVLKIKSEPFQVETTSKTTLVNFPAGYISHLAALKMMDLGLSGFEAMYGLPGTLGGALYMNSKWPKEHYQTSDNLVSVNYLDEQGELLAVPKEKLQFDYGYSSFQDKHWLILSASFAFNKANPSEIAKKHQAVDSYRKSTQPIGVKTAGCVFKNISEEEKSQYNLPTTSAGYLIDRCGLKGRRVGGMSVSEVHANFFVNENGATASEYRELAQVVRQAVKAQFKVDLKEEVDFVE